MKFSDISAEEWDKLAPYLDTCLVPYTGLNGTEKPWEATDALTRLRDFLALIEEPFRGRVVTYPAVQYEWPGSALAEGLGALSVRLRTAGFRYVVIATAQEGQAEVKVPDCDLFLQASGDLARDKERIEAAIQRMWRDGKNGNDS